MSGTGNLSKNIEGLANYGIMNEGDFMKTVVVKKKTKVDTINKALALVEAGGTIIVFPGVYEEKIKITKAGITLRGFNPENTIITYGDYAKKMHRDGLEYNTFRTYTLLLRADDICLQNLQIVNHSGPGKVYGQAVALATLGDQIRIENCILDAYQDTVFLGPLPTDLIERYQGFLPEDELIAIENARVLVTKTTIRGDVDFIFGCANAVFNDCLIVSKDGGYVAAPATPKEQEYGLTFINCRFQGQGSENTYLARPWRDYGMASFLNCTYQEHVRKEGFNEWDGTERDKTCRFYEYNCRYADSSPYARVGFARTLTEKEAEQYQIATIFKARG
jgi:pectinesterase